MYVHTFRIGARGGLTERRISDWTNISFHPLSLLRANFSKVEQQEQVDADFAFDELRSGFHGSDAVSRSLLRNHLRALYSLNALGEAVLRSDTVYDSVIFLRPDVLYLDPLPLVHLLDGRREHQLKVADFSRSCTGGEYNDRFVMGSLPLAITYARRLSAALEYAKTQPLHAETFLYQYLVRRNISVLEVPFRFRRIRSGGWTSHRDRFVISVSEQRRRPSKLQVPAVVKLLFPTNPYDSANIYCSPNPRVPIELAYVPVP